MEKIISEEGRGGVIFLVKYTLGFLFSTLASSWLSERLDVRGALSDPSWIQTLSLRLNNYFISFFFKEMI